PRRNVDSVAFRIEQSHQFEGQVRLPGPGISLDQEDVPLPAEDRLQFRRNRPGIGRRFFILNHTASRPPAAHERMTLAALKACSNHMVNSGLHPLEDRSKVPIVKGMHRCDSLDLISHEKFRSLGRRMHWRSAVLLIVAGAGILIAIAAPKLIVLQSLVMVSSAMLGVVAVVLVRRGARSLPSDPRIARVSQRLHELRRLAAAARQQSLANLDGNPESIAVYPWPEEEDVVRVEDHSVARRLTERLAPLPGARGPCRRIVEPSISRVRLSLTSRPTQADFGALPGDRRLLPPNRVRMVRPLECGATSALRTPVTIAGIGQTEGRLRGKGPA